MERSGAMPVPPATKRKRRSGGTSGKTNDPTGPSVVTIAPRLSVSTVAPKRAVGSTFTRNSSQPFAAVSSGADAMEYGTISPSSRASIAAWPARYEKELPSSARRRTRVVGVALRSEATRSRSTDEILREMPGADSQAVRTARFCRNLDYSSGCALDVDLGEVRVCRGRDHVRAVHVASRAALASGLVLIHPAVGGGEERFVRLAGLREDGRSDADPERQPFARTRLEVHLVDALLEFLALVLRLVGAAARQHDDELVARVANADVV